MEGWGPDRHNGRGPAWPAPQRSVVLASSILQTLLPFKAPGNGQFLPTRKCQPAAQFIDNLKLSLLTHSSRFFQRGYYCKQPFVESGSCDMAVSYSCLDSRPPRIGQRPP